MLEMQRKLLKTFLVGYLMTCFFFLSKVNSDFDERQRYVMKEISEITCGYATIFSNVGELISHLDCLVGFAVTAVIAPVPYSKPKIVSREEGLIKLVDARHPCLELLDNIAFIPNSIEFSNVSVSKALVSTLDKA